MSRFDLEATVQAIEKYKVDMWYSLAPMNKAILSMPGNDIRIVSLNTGEEQPAGESGEIVVGNAFVFKGYWQRPEATNETLKKGWVYTGDIGYLDDDGYLFFTGSSRCCAVRRRGRTG